MKPSLLIDALIKLSGKSLTQCATEMANLKFQGTLYKFTHDSVRSPSRLTATRIASYFKIPVDAIYDSAVAARVAAERGIDTSTTGDIAFNRANESLGVYRVAERDCPLSSAVAARIRALSSPQRTALEGVINAHLDAVAPEQLQKRRAAQ